MPRIFTRSKRNRIIAFALILPALSILIARLITIYYVPAYWTQLQHWAAIAAPGDVLRGNPALKKTGGTHWTPIHTQAKTIHFLYSDSPEYLSNDAQGRALACMRVTQYPEYRSHPARWVTFGAGLYHINKATDLSTGKRKAQTISLVVRLERTVKDKAITYINTRPATVRLVKGAYGLGVDMPIYAGRQCADHWFKRPNIQPATYCLQPGETRVLFTRTLTPTLPCINAMFDLKTDNAYFLKVYTVFGKVADYDDISFAPYEMTIGTNSGTGRYWKRILRPEHGTPPFDASNTHVQNRVHYRFETFPPARGLQYLFEETWDQRPENIAKRQIRRKGGQRRPFKGDYNVEYTVVIPVRSSTGKPAAFAILDTQRYGIYSGAARLATGQVVGLPANPDDLIHSTKEGEASLLARATVSSRTPTNYTFTWMLPGGSYGDQEFMLIPLGNIKPGRRADQ